MKALALYPADDEKVDGYFFIDTDGERLASRGGHWHCGASAGVFALNGLNFRSLALPFVGFRSAYIPGI